MTPVFDVYRRYEFSPVLQGIKTRLVQDSIWNYSESLIRVAQRSPRITTLNPSGFEQTLNLLDQVGASRKIILLISRVLLFFFGAALLLFGAVSMLVPRANFVSSTPPAGSTIAEPPTTVIVNFSNKLSPESQIDVVSTIRLSPSGEVEYLDGRTVMISSGLNAGDPSGRSMRAQLRPGLHKGLYFVSWRTKSAGWRSITYGKTHFTVGMPAPEYITRDNDTIWERDYNYRGRRAELIGGVVMIALAFALPMIRR